MKKIISVIFITILIFTGVIQSYADDTDLFLAQIPPDALMLLDQSGSMKWTISGQTMYIDSSQTCGSDVAYYPAGHTKACSIDPYNNPSQYPYTAPVPKYSNESCSGPFYIYSYSRAGYSTDCTRLAIAKRSIFDLLNDNKDTVIDGRDETSLGIRLAYMRFRDGDDTAEDYNSGNIRLGRKNTSGCTESSSTADALVIGSSYVDIINRVNCGDANAGTPLASSLNEAKLYLDAHKAGDNAAACRKKFVILVTDGADTFACGCSDIYHCGSEAQYDQYKRRRESVAKAKALADAGYYVFVVGFGAGMPYYLINTINWMAHFGGTDNPLVPNSGNINGYNPASVSSCQSSSTALHTDGHYYATSNDPGETSLSGYAFFAEDPSQLTNALKAIKKYIQEKAYSLTSAAIPLVRLIDKDVVYITSVETPSWNGNLKSYQLNEDGTLPVDPVTKLINVNPVWDAGVILNQKNPDDRKIYTYLGGAGKEEFKLTNSNLTKEALGVPDDINRNKLINHVRGIDAYDLNGNGNTTELREWKLGDIFHSNPVIIGEPSRFFIDEGFSGVGGFYQANKDRTKVIFVGANDGMLHAFNTSTGDEVWGFIPNSLLKNLLSMVSTHTYYVDSSPKVADVWFDSNGDNIKSAGEWRTLLVCGLRKGGKTYFALNITDTLNPIYLWEFPKSTDSATLAKVGQSWSEPAIGRVKIESGSNLVEKWVAFIGGGFDYANNVGKALYVIDINTGDIIKEFYGLSGMDYSLTAPPIAVDTNLDGYVDKVYMGDLGGQMWAFDVSFDETTKKSDSQWTGKKLFTAPVAPTEKHRIYYQPAVAFDRYRNPWVYFGTGDREYPKDDSNPPERFYAIKDDGLGTYPRVEGDGPNDVKDVTGNNTFTPPSNSKGWYIQLGKSAGRLEKVLAKPSVFNRLVYFTTYTYTGTTSPCTVAGEGRLYVVEYLSGGGALEVDDLSDLAGTPSSRSTEIGAGIPSPPTISVNLKGKASVNVGTTSNQIFSDKIFSPSNTKEIIYWREVIP
jgi:type IV pilus assembly protein PilY1